HARHGLASQAITHLRATTSGNPTLTTLAIAELHGVMGEPDQAIALLHDDLDDLIARQNGLALLAARTIADAYAQLGDMQAALDTLEKLIAAKLLVDEALLLQVDLLMARGDLAAARTKL